MSERVVWIRVGVGVLCLLVGGVWIGQGAGWIHGSFMTGEAVWLVIGLVVFALGAWLVVSAVRARRTP